jgi:hypothetical protein
MAVAQGEGAERVVARDRVGAAIAFRHQNLWIGAGFDERVANRVVSPQ